MNFTFSQISQKLLEKKSILFIVGITLTLIILYFSTLFAKTESQKMQSVSGNTFGEEKIVLENKLEGASSTQTTIGLIDSLNQKKIIVEPSIANSISYSRIIHQLETVRSRRLVSKSWFEFFVRISFSLIVIKTIFLLFTTVIGILLTKNGWQNAGKQTVAMFLVTAGFSIAANAFPEAIRIDDQIEENKKFYMALSQTEAEILSYLSTGLNTSKVQEEPKDYVVSLDKTMDKHHSLCVVNFNSAKIPTFIPTEKEDSLGN